jgi:hypothetical protein
MYKHTAGMNKLKIEVGPFKIVEFKGFRKTGTEGYAYWFIGGGLFTVVCLVN